MPRTVHVVGAGLAGLAAAVRLAARGVAVLVHEAAGVAGGRCRSYHDPLLDMVIDNGNHLLLSGNHAALSYLEAIGSKRGLAGPTAADFAFVDLASGERWTLRINSGRLPWWIFDRSRRVPGTTARDYLSFAPLLYASHEKTLCAAVRCAGPLYERLARPFWLAALNIEPKEASAALAGVVLRETLLAGGKACRPLIARDGLGPVFIEPALRFLEERHAKVLFGHRLRSLDFAQGKVASLDFGDDKVPSRDDDVILAVPPATLAPIIGIVNGTIEWLFAFPDRLSVTISAADRLLDVPREALAQKLWQEVATVAGLPMALPPWQIVRERRATFAATPGENGKRPAAATAWSNLWLAGDWTKTGLPATIEGAIRSGTRAADLVARS